MGSNALCVVNRKRQTKVKADAEAEKDEAEAVDELPEDVLAAIAARHEYVDGLRWRLIIAMD